MGQLIPLTWYETLPGDSFQQRSSILLRVTPILAPLMHPVIIRVHNFFVPLRLIWDDFEKFITGDTSGNDTTDRPYISLNSAVSESSLHDYLGIPPIDYTGKSMEVSALPFRAYSLIFNEHYRDQDLVTELTVSGGNGADSTTNTTIQTVSWEKDWASTIRGFEQRGSDVNIPLGTTAPVVGLGYSGTTYGADGGTYYEADLGSRTYANTVGTAVAGVALKGTGASGAYPDVHADLSQATGISVTDLRLYLALQRYKEAMAEGGARYVEYLAHRWGVKSSDARLNLPEYISGGRQSINFSEVLSTTEDGTREAGIMRGHGIAAMRTKRSRRFFEEHGLVMTLMSIVPKAIYSDGIDRSWLREDKEDYFTKELQLIGDRVVENKEIYADHTTPEGTFGYQQRYDEYRSRPSGIAGEFRSSLNHWHYARIFSGDPSLNSTFIECAPTKRQYQDNSSDSFYIMCNHSIQARRQIAKYPKKRVL